MGDVCVCWDQYLLVPGVPLSHCVWLHLCQGAVESLRLALGGSVANAGALTDCPFQGDSSTSNSGEVSDWLKLP